MEKNVKKIAWYSLLTLLVVVIICVGVFIKSDVKQEQQSFGGAAYGSIDVVGTRVGTSTTPVAFTNNSATSTYISYLGNEVDNLTYTIRNTATAAGGGANAYFTLLGSNDAYCNTATTSPDYGNPVLMKDINWFDLGDQLKGKVHSTSLGSGTSTIAWTSPLVGTGREIILEDLNTKCIALQVNASGTSLWIQQTAKTY